MSLAEYGYYITTQNTNNSWSPQEYKILYDGSGNGTFAKDSSQASLTYVCEYQYFPQFLDVVLGKTVVSGGSLLRSASGPNFDPNNGSTPDLHPFCDNFFAASAEVTPLGQAVNAGNVPVWNKAKVTVVYRPPDYNVISDSNYSGGDIESGRFTSKIPSGSAEFQTSQGRFYFYTDPNMRPLDIQPGFVLAAQKYTYTWKQIPVITDSGVPNLGAVPNLTTILQLLGTVNGTTFDFGFDPGTVLFNSFSPKLILPQVADPGGYYWDISYDFGIRDYGASTTPVVSGEHVGWNYAYDPMRKIWDLYTNSQTSGVMGDTMYQYANQVYSGTYTNDLNTLFMVTW